MAGGGQEPSLGRAIEQTEIRLLSQLSRQLDRYRTVIILHDLEALTNVEIAELLGASLDTVKIRLRRARRKLQAALAAHCDFCRDEYDVFVCDPCRDIGTGTAPSRGHQPPWGLIVVTGSGAPPCAARHR